MSTGRRFFCFSSFCFGFGWLLPALPAVSCCFCFLIFFGCGSSSSSSSPSSDAGRLFFGDLCCGLGALPSLCLCAAFGGRSAHGREASPVQERCDVGLSQTACNQAAANCAFCEMLVHPETAGSLVRQGPVRMHQHKRTRAQACMPSLMSLRIQ